jgi:phytol kinase
MTSFAQVAIAPVLLLSVMGVLSRINNSQVIVRELKRKALHIGVGLTALSFPLFLNERWMIITALGLVVAWFMAVRQIPCLRRHFGSVLHDVKRESFGEMYFALSIGGLLLLTQNEPILFVIPMLILALADASAAIVGKVFPIGPLAGMARGKTAAGCTAFFVVAFTVSYWSLTSFAELQPAHTLMVAAGLAVTTCVAEAISRRGIDNLVVPGMAYLFLLWSGIPNDAGNTTIVQLQLELNTLMAGL